MVFWIGSCVNMGGGRLREVVTHGGFTVCLKSLIELLSLLNENSKSSLEVVCSSCCLQMRIVWFNVVLNVKFIVFFLSTLMFVNGNEKI